LSNGRTHRSIGPRAGGGHALATAKQQPVEHLLLEVVGGALAGNLGARLPDVLDLPLYPRHRSLAHGIVPVSVVARAAVTALGRWQAQLRTEASRRAPLLQSAASPFERLWQALAEILGRLGAGALASLVAGYRSHFALDAFTPASLPLLA
jgi:membrane-bound metal-dependent hydrolase YbcI (DUF457 family)